MGRATVSQALERLLAMKKVERIGQHYPIPKAVIMQDSGKIKHYRSLFGWRDDIFARRWDGIRCS